MKIRFLFPACRELNEVVAFYNRERRGLGNDFRDEAWETLHRIMNFPLAWHSLGGDIRRCQMHRFPYGIIYEPLDIEIVVISVANLHRKPEYWRDRL